MTYELKEERNLKKYLGILAFLGTGALTGSAQTASNVKEKVEGFVEFFDGDSDRASISSRVEQLIGESWEAACIGYDIPIECRKELAQYNIMNSLDDWDSLSTIRCNIIRICKKNNVSLVSINANDIARKFLGVVIAKLEDDEYFTARSWLREILADTGEIKQKLDDIFSYLFLQL